MRSLLSRRLRAAACATALGATLLALGAGPASAAAPGTRYYLALGDSLAAGFQTLPGGGSEVGHGYAQDLAATLGGGPNRPVTRSPSPTSAAPARPPAR